MFFKQSLYCHIEGKYNLLFSTEQPNYRQVINLIRNHYIYTPLLIGKVDELADYICHLSSIICKLCAIFTILLIFYTYIAFDKLFGLLRYFLL